MNCWCLLATEYGDPKARELSQPQAQLLDAASGLTKRQTRLLISLAEFLAEIPVKGGGKRGTGAQ